MNSILNKFDRFTTTFNPNNVFILFIDLLISLVIVIEMWSIPLRLALYDNEVDYYIIPYFKFISVAILLIKVLVSLNTGIFLNGKKF